MMVIRRGYQTSGNGPGPIFGGPSLNVLPSFRFRCFLFTFATQKSAVAKIPADLLQNVIKLAIMCELRYVRLTCELHGRGTKVLWQPSPVGILWWN